ncbi:MAG: hypothetical protein M3P18_13725 [Actinomycetota bacterium]|nr:hypothetical protein [Actinomycetota bacterium]
MRQRFETVAARTGECCSRFDCVQLAVLRWEGDPSCAAHFVRDFSKATAIAKTDFIVDLVRANGFMEITWLGDVSLAQLAEAANA